MERLRRYGLRLKAAKCRFGLTQVEYLGHIVSGAGIALSDERKRAVAEVVAPTNTAQVRAFVGLANYFRDRSEEHTSELQSLMRISYAVFCLKKKTKQK